MSSPNQAANPASNDADPKNQSFNGRVQSVLNFLYLRSLFFIIKIFLIVLHLAGAIAVSVRYDNWGSTRYYNFVAVTGIVVAVISIFLNFFRVTEKVEKVPWNLCELVFDVLWAVLILIASAIITDFARKYEYMDSYAAGAFFGYAALLTYIIDAVIRLVGLIRGDRKK